MEFGLRNVAGITVICYLIGEVVKLTKRELTACTRNASPKGSGYCIKKGDCFQCRKESQVI